MESKPEVFKTYLSRRDDEGEEVSLPIEISYFYTPGDPATCDNPAYEEIVEIVGTRVGSINVELELTKAEESKLELDIREDIHNSREEQEAEIADEVRNSRKYENIMDCFGSLTGKAV